MARRLGPLPIWLWLVVAVALGGAGTALALSGGDGTNDRLAAPSTVDIATTTSVSTEPTTAPPLTVEPASTTQAPTTTPDTSSSTPPGSPSTTTIASTAALPYDLVITEHWYFPSGDHTFDYGGIVENRGTQTATGFISVNVDFYDATGRILSTETAFVDMVVPGTPTPFASLLIDPAAEPVRMEVRVSDDIFVDPAPGPEGALTVGNVEMADAGGFVDITGDATSTFEIDLDYVQLVALWRDGNGTVAFAASGYLERLPAGATEAFTISALAEYVPLTPPTEILISP